MELRQITRKDIAKEAGVSETVVSYVINGNRYVLAEKRKRVEEAIEKLNYRPNTMARALKGKQSNHILLIADDIKGEYFGKLMSEIDQLAYKEGYFVTLCEDRADEDFIQRIYSRFFDGILIGSASFSVENIQRLINASIPIVLLEIKDYSSITGSFGLINTGLYDGAITAVNTLYEKGRKSLLFLDRIGGKGTDITDWRTKGFLDQTKKLKLNADALSGYQNAEELDQMLSEYMKNASIDGIVGRNDYVALVGMQVCKNSGIRIGVDCSVIGFDDSRSARYSDPPLTSIAINQKEIARAVISMLMALMKKDENHQILRENLSTTLVMRESV
ncbi:MAG: LacI family transcriptional regulator [Spirochaetales bacterium]|nr:LacI family transcriptional regulator [Spirochaetales bacterium]